MNWYNINLASHRICPAAKRRQIYGGMLLYLSASIILLALTASHATTQVKEGIISRQRARNIQQNFKNTHPSSISMRDYADLLKQIIQSNIAQTAYLNQALPNRVHTVLPLMVSLINQPDQSQLHKLNFKQQPDQGGTELDFSIRVPTTQRDEVSFLNNWKNNDRLTQQLEAIIPSTTQRGAIGKQEIFIMSYKAKLKE